MWDLTSDPWEERDLREFRDRMVKEVDKTVDNCIMRCYPSPVVIKVIKSWRIRWVDL